MIVSTGKGEAVFVSPYTGEQFTSQFAFNDHVLRWPEIARANGLNLDGSASAPKAAPRESHPAPKRGRRKT